MQNLRFQRGDEVKRIGSNSKLIVKTIANDPNRESIMKGDKETGPDLKGYLCTWNDGKREQFFKDEDLEFWKDSQE